LRTKELTPGFVRSLLLSPWQWSAFRLPGARSDVTISAALPVEKTWNRSCRRLQH